MATGALLLGSWFGFVWAVANNYVLQINLAYFISPLVKKLLGVVFLPERLRTADIVLTYYYYDEVGADKEEWHGLLASVAQYPKFWGRRARTVTG